MRSSPRFRSANRERGRLDLAVAARYMALLAALTSVFLHATNPRDQGKSSAERKVKEGEISPMMSNEGYQDRILTCRECGQDFTFSTGEQEFYASRGLTNAPGRCPSCRAARRGGQSSTSRPRSTTTAQYETTCATCGRPTSVPFIPREDRPVYCNACFQAQRAARGPRREESHTTTHNSYGGGGYGGGRERERHDRRDYRERW
jgi:CxxC-x17-CxxC domain-containing protein